jgi:hypothetical protein
MESQPRRQKLSSILMKFSAIAELLILSILIKKFFKKLLFFRRQTQNTFRSKNPKTLKKRFFCTFCQGFLHQNNVENKFQDHKSNSS